MASIASFPTRPLPTDSGRGTRQAQPGLWSRLGRAVTLLRQRRSEANVARFIELNGGKITDSLEREIERRFMDF